MYSQKLHSGGTMPSIFLSKIGGGEIELGRRSKSDLWKLVFIYRGNHCPVCHQYLKRLESLREQFLKAGAEIVAASADPEDRARAMVEKESLQFPVAYGLSVRQMQSLGLWISEPRSPEETDRPFAEPSMFAINEEDRIHLIDQSNTPFNRADLSELLETVEWVRENNYPIRGTYGQI
ncbi:MAG: redoxin domain-containing protein [Verrucomicrobiota bacterium]